MAEKLLEVKNLRTEFKRDKTWVTAVNNVSFSIQPGEILGLVGESGCGKSVTSLSIMKLLARNSKISNGEILLNGKDLLKEDKKGMRKIRGREVAMIFQEPMNSLNPCMRIEKQLTEAILLHNNFSKEEAHNRAFEVLKSVGIPEPDMTLKSYPHQLSGGMCQRVMIAMAMSCEPELLIADEPTTALDVTIQAQILELMEDIRAKKNTGILMITHDLGVVAEMCSRVVVMYAGRIVEEAPVQELFADPKHPYMSAIIERNSILPCSKIRGFSTAADYQSEVKIEILQGEEPYAEDNVQLGVVTVAVPKKKKGMESVDVRFTYDINGILEVEVTVVSTGKSVKKVLSQNMDEKELARRMKQLEKLKVHPKDMTENQLILERLQALYEEALPETRDRLMYHIRNFESTLVEQDPRRIRKYREFLEHMIASLEHYDPFEGKLDFPEWSDDDDGET